MDGRVEVDGFDTTFEEAGIGDMNTHVFSDPQTREVSEIGLSPFMLAYANNGHRNYTLIPVFPLRTFRHKSIFVRTDRGIKSPEDLRGRKVATPGYSSTSLTWIRGIMQHEYGVSPNEVQWVISTKDSSAEAAGKVSKQEQVMPKGITLAQGPAGMDESDLLVNGEVDALFHAAEPRAYVQGNPIVARLFADYRETERAYFSKTGIFPIMHAVAVRKDVIDANPQLPKAVFDAYSKAKKLMYEHMRKLAWATISLPWIGQEIEETRALMGENFWPYGIEPNRKALEALFEYSYEQGLANKKLTIEELFHPSTLELVDFVLTGRGVAEHLCSAEIFVKISYEGNCVL
jgi:4,5-dihydroxyphthalate decarboxylase